MKRVFITGASTGIGAALARAYAAQGACVGLVARRAPLLDALIASLPHPERHRAYALDVTDHAALTRAAEAFIGVHGGIDIVVANAGVSRGTLTELAEDMAVFDRIVATNLVATAATFSACLPAMQRQAAEGAGGLRLVGIASVAGIRGLPGAGAYSASKAAVIRYCESLRLELRDSGIRVVTIAPGYIDTPMTRVNTYPMPFLMKVDDFAERALRVIEQGRSYRVIPWQMGWVARLLLALPNALYDALFAKAPRKTRG